MSILVGELYNKERCPSGQREQTVNLPAYAYVGSNPALSTKLIWSKLLAGVAQLVEHQPSKLRAASSNLVSRSICDNSGKIGKGCPCGLVVEHTLGKGEIMSSILIMGSQNKDNNKKNLIGGT